MRKRTRYIAVAAIAVAALLLLIGGIGLWSAAKTGPRLVTHEKFEKIQLGMTIEEVERIMDMPAEWDGKLQIHDYDWPNEVDFNMPTGIFADEYAMIIVSAINVERKVVAKKIGTRRRPTWLEHLGEILGW